ncbi:hypothetical protein SAMN05444266_101616 [Chitinophaga jiangningensis]|uniref:Uncharacterized protein n=1 Tax=Chitinophaga jiangningensis TaxID=1419482 RepID=A0A1M6WGJ2_9BACT|nr:phage tail tape measure protein [Chitinophaga jiangningensis]SHK92801.1 hypothetical protein SAMN05444266_101616 [Chitinophaga jiangningensis]
MAIGKVEKIYSLKTLGYDTIIRELNDVDAAFQRIRRSKQSASERFNTSQDSAEARKLSEELANLTKEEAKLRVERQRLMNEAKAQQAARQAEITQREKERDFVNEELRKQAELRTAREQTALKIKEEQLQRQQEISQRKQEKLALDGVAGSYNAIAREARELSRATKAVSPGQQVSFRGEILAYDQAIEKLKVLSKAEQDWRRQFTRDNLLVGEYTSGIIQSFQRLGLDDLISGQITKAQTRLKALDSTFQELRNDLSAIRVTGEGSLEAVERQMIENRQEAIRLRQEVDRLRNDFRGAGDIGNQITASISAGFKEARNQIAQFVLGYVGVQAMLSGLQRGVATAKEISDETTALEIELGRAVGGADAIVSGLRQLDTRTKVKELENIANVALRAGTTEQNLLGVARAVDITKVAFGKDFGSVEEGTETFAKLINIFYADGEITGERILQIGNGIRTLANETVASVPYINDFAGRMAGLRQISNITLPDVIGLGAGFEEFKQSAEVSSTVLVKVIPKLASETEKYAAIAKMTTDQFRELLNNNPAEALLRISENLVKSGTGIEDVAAALADAELGAGRATTILATLGGKADVFRERIARAKQATADTGAVLDAFNAKNENLAATLDKIGKKFSDAAGSKAFLATLTGISGVILFFLSNLPVILTLLTLWTVGWTVLNKEMLIAHARLLLVNAQLVAGRVALAAITILQNAFAISIGVVTGAYRLATAAALLFNNTIRATPLGVILTIIGLLAGAFVALGAAVTNSSAALGAHAAQLKLNAEVANQVKQQTDTIINRMSVLTAVAKDNTASLASRTKALQDLIALSPQYLSGLTLENIRTAEGKQILDGYIQSLKQKAELQAGEAISNKAIEERTKLQKTLYDLETKRAQGLTGKRDLTEEERSFLPAGRRLPFGALTGSIFTGVSTVDAAINGVKAAIAAKDLEVEQANNFVKAKLTKLGATVDAGNKSIPTVKPVRNAETVKAELKALDDEIDKAEFGSKKLADLVARRKQLQDELDKETGKFKDSLYHGSRLTGSDKDVLREIDSQRDQLLADQKLRYTEGKVSEEDYLASVLHINQEAVDKKLKLVTAGNAAEKKLISELKLERITAERETNEQLFALKERNALSQLEQSKKQAEAALKAILDNPRSSDLEKAQAKLAADKLMLAAQEKFNSEMDTLEKQFSIRSRQNSVDRKNAMIQVQQDLTRDEIAVSKQSVADIMVQAEKGISDFRLKMAKIRAEILGDPSMTTPRKKQLTDKVDKTEAVGVLAREVNAMKQQLPLYKQLLDQKKISDQEYYSFVEALYKKQEALHDANESSIRSHTRSIQELIRDGISSSLRISSEYTEIVDKAIAETYSLAKDAMNSYFDSERAQIQESLRAQQERLDLELQQKKARTQSQAEQERLDKEYANKKRQAEVKAGEDLKRVKKAEARIALATELANIWASAYQLGPIAGPIAGGIFSLMALGRYALRVKEIESTKFEYGGMPALGGKIGGKPHSAGGTPFSFRGRQYEAEVNELSIIRTRNAPSGKFTITGNHAQIASTLNQLGGGVSFAPGGMLHKFAYGGSLGTSLPAPAYYTLPASPAMPTTNVDVQFSSIIETLQQQGAAIVAVSGRIDRLQVTQDTDSVRNALQKKVKQQSPGTL